jgi:hypothetical protein
MNYEFGIATDSLQKIKLYPPLAVGIADEEGRQC